MEMCYEMETEFFRGNVKVRLPVKVKGKVIPLQARCGPEGG